MRRASIAAAAALALVACGKKKSSESSGPPGDEPVSRPGGGKHSRPAPDHAEPQPSTDASFGFAIQEPAARPGDEAVAWVVIHPQKGFHVNTDYDTKLSIDVPDGVTVTRKMLSGPDAETFSRSELAFAIPMTPTGAGRFAVGAMLKFATCDDGACYPKKLPLRFDLQSR